MSDVLRPAVPRTEPLEGCPACGRGCDPQAFSVPDRIYAVPGLFSYCRCAACGSVYQSPRVVEPDLDLVYPEAYYTHSITTDVPPASGVVGRGGRDEIRRRVIAAVQDGGPHNAPGWLGRVLAKNRWFRERAFRDLAVDEMIPRSSKPGRALDVGCGAGELMIRLSILGWEVEGLERDEAAAAVARSRGLAVHVAHAATPDQTLGTFSLIVLNHVLEHLSDPAAVLAEAATHLDANGRIVLIYPSPESLGARWFGPSWFAWDAPRHLVLPTRRGLRHLARHAGLRLASARTLSRWAERHSAYSRAHRAGRSVALGYRESDFGDRFFGLVERFSVILGVPVGEELVACLVR